MAAQHPSLSLERWSSFTIDQQILMIGNEMNRAAKLMTSEDSARLMNCYERILHLTDLTIALHERRSLRRELLRWRDLIAAMFVSGELRPNDHAKAFRCLLYFTPEASKQIPFCLPG
jgi:hypothetical protein